MRRMNDGLLGLLVTALIYIPDVVRAGSCSSAKLCCQGRDSGCVIQKESPNAIIASPRDKPCYCDHACLKLADCCDDFKETCGVVDCAVSEWSLWTPCDNGCGSGTQRRTRLVEVPEKNGGKHCPKLDQVRTCRSFHNCRTALHPQLREKGSRVCVERHGDEILERLVGIGRWKLSGGVPGVEETSANATSCHGKWIGDGRLPVSCDDERCERAPRTPHVAQLFRRSRRSVGIGNADRASRTKSRVVRRRRRRGRRRKRSRRRSEGHEEP